MTRLGVSNDFSKEYIRSWLYCVVPMSVNVIFVMLSYLAMEKGQQNQPTIERLRFFATYVVSNGIMLLAIVSFITLLRNIYKRFLILNSMLRFELLVFHWFFEFCARFSKYEIYVYLE